MSPIRFTQLREIIAAAEELPENRRAAYVEQACGGDEPLRREALSLLQWDAAASPVVGTGRMPQLLGLPPPGDALDQALPARIGAYKVRGVLGQGGMGVVYEAEQGVPIRRAVAIKRVYPGMKRGAVLARFEEERHHLARMSHPGIARIYDAGEDEQGSYFVMELVRGKPITQYCRDEGLSQRARLRLFRDTCHAVQHAHQKGVIHRDLKPSNVLVTEEDGRPRPKVIDFGIAIALNDVGDAVSRRLTAAGQLVGTVDYMSPEQLAGDATAGVDTRSDVYSLGVLLYELLSGRLPMDTKGKSLLEAMSLAAAAEPRALRQQDGGAVDNDLVAITLMALNKEPAQRYASAAALADDLDRWMDGQAVLAVPPSTTYQLRKLIARNRISTGLAMALVLSALVFGLVMAQLYQEQRETRAKAEVEATRAQSVSSFLVEMLSSVESRGSTVTVREILDEAAVEVGSGTDREFEATLHSTLGKAYLALGLFEDAHGHLGSAHQIRLDLFGAESVEVGESLGELANYHRAHSYGLESLSTADSLARRALELARAEAEPDPEILMLRVASLAKIQAARLRASAADSLYREAIILAREYGATDKTVASLLLDRALPLYQLGRPAAAAAVLREALDNMNRGYPGDHPLTSRCLHDLSYLVPSLAERESLLLESLAMSKRLWGANSDNLVQPLASLQGVYDQQQQLGKAEDCSREVLRIVELWREPDNVEIARAANNLGSVLSRQGHGDEAATLMTRALEIWRAKLGEMNGLTMVCRSNLGEVLDLLGRDDEAWEVLEEGWTLSQAPQPASPSVASLCARRMASFLMRRSYFAEAEYLLAQAVELSLGASLNSQARARQEYARCLRELGHVNEALTQHAMLHSLVHERDDLEQLRDTNLEAWDALCEQAELESRDSVGAASESERPQSTPQPPAHSSWLRSSSAKAAAAGKSGRRVM